MPSKTRSSSSLPSFANSPLVEVVAGVQFAKIQQFKAPDLGDLWDAFGRKEFPDCQEQALLNKIMIAPDVIMPEQVVSFDFISPSELPRMWFISKDKTALIQFQKDRFLYNWRKIDGAKNNDYPRYKTVIANFMQHYQQIEKCLHSLKIESPSLEMLELTYVNLIPAETIKGLGNIGNAFGDMAWRSEKRFLDAPNRINAFWQFVIPATKAIAHVHLVTAQRIQDGKSVLKLEMSTRGQALDNTVPGMKKWFDASHEWLVRAFDDLTTPAMHKLWKKKYEK